jgi:hypothetical protein
MSTTKADPELGLPSRTPTDKMPPSITISEKNSTSYFSQQPITDLLPDLKKNIDIMRNRYIKDNPDKKIGQPKNFSIFRWIQRRHRPVRFAIYLAPLAILLVIPIALLSTIFSNKTVYVSDVLGAPTYVKVAGIVVWIEIAVLAMWVAYTVSWVCIIAFNEVCDKLQRRVKSHQLLIDALKDIAINLMHLPATLVIWTVICFATTPAICVFPDDRGKCSLPNNGSGWVSTLNRVFEAGIVVSFIIWIERCLIAASFISYYGKQYDRKSEVLQGDIAQVKKLFYLTLHRQPKHGHKYHYIDSQRCKDCKLHPNQANVCLASWEQDWNDIFTSAISHQDSAEALGVYLWYAIKLDITDPGWFIVEDKDKLLKKDLLTQELRDWVCREHDHIALPKKDWITEVRREDFESDSDQVLPNLDITAYTDILNGDNDEDITYDEMRTAVRRLGRRKQALEKTLKNVREAMESLDRPLSCIVLIAIAFVYGKYFPKKRKNTHS